MKNQQALVEQIVQNLTFEVEAVPKSKSNETSSISQSTPLNVKIKVRKKDEIYIPHNDSSIADDTKKALQKVRLVNNDQTIMTFDVFMEAEFEKKPPRKLRKNIVDKLKPGICLGATDDDNSPYMPGSSYTANLTEPIGESKSDGTLKQTFMLSKNVHQDYRVVTKPEGQKRFFGKCKPGGCLDPPFGEDKYPYEPSKEPPVIIPEQVDPNEEIRLRDEDTVECDEKNAKRPSKSSNEGLKNKSRHSSIFDGGFLNKKRKSSDKSTNTKLSDKADSDLNLNQVKSAENSDISHSNSIITYPFKLSSDLRITDDKAVTSRGPSEDKPRKSFNDHHSEPYFVPPKNVNLIKNKDRLNQKDNPKRQTSDEFNSKKSVKESIKIPVPIPIPIPIPNTFLSNKKEPEAIATNGKENLKTQADDAYGTKLIPDTKDNINLKETQQTGLTTGDLDNSPTESSEMENSTPFDVAQKVLSGKISDKNVDETNLFPKTDTNKMKDTTQPSQTRTPEPSEMRVPIPLPVPVPIPIPKDFSDFKTADKSKICDDKKLNDKKTPQLLEYSTNTRPPANNIPIGETKLLNENKVAVSLTQMTDKNIDQINFKPKTDSNEMKITAQTNEAMDLVPSKIPVQIPLSVSMNLSDLNSENKGIIIDDQQINNIKKTQSEENSLKTTPQTNEETKNLNNNEASVLLDKMADKNGDGTNFLPNIDKNNMEFTAQTNKTMGTVPKKNLVPLPLPVPTPTDFNDLNRANKNILMDDNQISNMKKTQPEEDSTKTTPQTNEKTKDFNKNEAVVPLDKIADKNVDETNYLPKMDKNGIEITAQTTETMGTNPKKIPVPIPLLVPIPTNFGDLNSANKNTVMDDKQNSDMITTQPVKKSTKTKPQANDTPIKETKYINENKAAIPLSKITDNNGDENDFPLRFSLPQIDEKEMKITAQTNNSSETMRPKMPIPIPMPVPIPKHFSDLKNADKSVISDDKQTSDMKITQSEDFFIKKTLESDKNIPIDKTTDLNGKEAAVPFGKMTDNNGDETNFLPKIDENEMKITAETSKTLETVPPKMPITIPMPVPMPTHFSDRKSADKIVFDDKQTSDMKITQSKDFFTKRTPEADETIPIDETKFSKEENVSTTNTSTPTSRYSTDPVSQITDKNMDKTNILPKTDKNEMKTTAPTSDTTETVPSKITVPVPLPIPIPIGLSDPKSADKSMASDDKQISDMNFTITEEYSTKIPQQAVNEKSKDYNDSKVSTVASVPTAKLLTPTSQLPQPKRDSIDQKYNSENIAINMPTVEGHIKRTDKIYEKSDEKEIKHINDSVSTSYQKEISDLYILPHKATHETKESITEDTISQTSLQDLQKTKLSLSGSITSAKAFVKDEIKRIKNKGNKDEPQRYPTIDTEVEKDTKNSTIAQLDNDNDVFSESTKPNDDDMIDAHHKIQSPTIKDSTNFVTAPVIIDKTLPFQNLKQINEVYSEKNSFSKPGIKGHGYDYTGGKLSIKSPSNIPNEDEKTESPISYEFIGNQSINIPSTSSVKSTKRIKTPDKYDNLPMNMDKITPGNKARHRPPGETKSSGDKLRNTLTNKSNARSPSIISSMPSTSTLKSAMKKDTFSVELAFHSYVNDKNERTLTTFDAEKTPTRYANDSVTIIKSQIRVSSNEIRIPVDSDHDMCLQIKKPNNKHRVSISESGFVNLVDDSKMKQSSSLQNSDADMRNPESTKQHDNKIGTGVSDCNFIDLYEQELVPLQSVIKSLRDEIDVLATQQLIFKDRIICPNISKFPRLVHSNRKCIGCVKK